MYLEAIDVPGVVPRGLPLVGRTGCPEQRKYCATRQKPPLTQRFFTGHKRLAKSVKPAACLFLTGFTFALQQIATAFR
ncbi:hypothetical protein GUY68_003971 [Salmonella enterica]|nr:hypothetical protein [Salmonella enterica]EDY4421754.1 hypothetical protein [Salmonella enterica]